MLGFARKIIGFARKFFQDLCSTSLGDRLKVSDAWNAWPFFCSRWLGSKIQNQKLCSRSLSSKNPMLEMLEINVFATWSQLYLEATLIKFWSITTESNLSRILWNHCSIFPFTLNYYPPFSPPISTPYLSVDACNLELLKKWGCFYSFYSKISALMV